MKTIPRGTKSKNAMRLAYLPVNAAYTFIVGENPLRMSDEPLFFQTRAEAVAAAKRHGLGVAKSGLVHSVGENPFAKATGLSRRNERGGTWEDYFEGVEQALVEEGYKASVANDWRQIVRTSWASGKTIGEVLRHLIKLERESAKVARHERGENPVTPRRAAVIERSHHAYERAREAHDPKKFKRGGGYTPDEQRAIAHAAGLKRAPSNRALGKLELHRFKTERPEHIFAYYKGDARIGEPITNWMGDVLGHVVTRGGERRARGVKLVSIHMKAITGDTYAGTCNLETGNYCKMKKMVSKGPSAAKHERGDNPRVSHALKARMNKVLGKR